MSASPLLLLKPPTRYLGRFSVRRALPGMPHRMVGPFIFLDHMGPADFAPGTGIDVRTHPHIGLATVTYLFEGEILHRDSLGTVQSIAPGDVNWMTAGRGIVHSERTAPELRRTGARMQGLQTWVALPKKNELADPAFSHHPKATLPLISAPGVELRVVAGSAFRKHSPPPVLLQTLFVRGEMDAGRAFGLGRWHEALARRSHPAPSPPAADARSRTRSNSPQGLRSARVSDRDRRSGRRVVRRSRARSLPSRAIA